MTLNDQKCAFSEAWLRAVTAAAGFGLQGGTTPDDQSVDVTIASRLQGMARNPRLDVQLKCTATAVPETGDLIFDLKQKNFEDLRAEDVTVPSILVVLYVPDNPVEWIRISEEKLELYRCGWWMSIRGANAPRTQIPRNQIFSPQALTDIMNRLAQGGMP